MEPAIELRGVSKVYRLYRKPAYRLLDLFGLLRQDGIRYREHAALSDVDLCIARGERVAVIGRNGAGKSTLLKIVTGTIHPTRGAITVHGRISALLQIGTGFHPDFTGRENVLAGLAHQGIVGRQAAERLDEIVAFAELEEYIDQPMKTYSTGMAMRLMFAAATSIEPDILVVDEVLGVGDAYFAAKSLERMRNLCSRHGTTFLLVTHDLYSAANMCHRFIWIDRGVVRFDGDAKTALARYEQSIKEEEERRLQAKQRLRVVRTLGESTGCVGAVMLRLSSSNGFALPEPCDLAAVRIDAGAGAMAADILGETDGWRLTSESNLGRWEDRPDRRVRVFHHYGAIFHKAEWIWEGGDRWPAGTLAIEFRYPGRVPIDVDLVIDGKEMAVGSLSATGDSGWRRMEFPLQEATPKRVATKGGRYGTGRIVVEDFRVLDANGFQTHRLRGGQRVTLEIDLRWRDPSADRRPTIVVALQREGTSESCRFLAENLTFPSDLTHARVRADLGPLLLEGGRFIGTVAVCVEDYFQRPGLPFFTHSPLIHDIVTRFVELEVEPSHPALRSTFMRHPAQWTLVDRVEAGSCVRAIPSLASWSAVKEGTEVLSASESRFGVSATSCRFEYLAESPVFSWEGADELVFSFDLHVEAGAVTVGLVDTRAGVWSVSQNVGTGRSRQVLVLPTGGSYEGKMVIAGANADGACAVRVHIGGLSVTCVAMARVVEAAGL